MKLEDLKELHAPYLADVAKYTGFVHSHDASTRPEGIHHLIRLLTERGSQSVGEFGTGFSTVGLRTWRRRTRRNIKFTTIEHDAQWCKFMAGTLKKRRLPAGDIETLDEYRLSTLMVSAPPFDAVFIDHGPTMATRWCDVPWIISLVQPGGLVIFDDWWPAHVRAFRSTKRIIRILTRMGIKWQVLEESRPAAHDKAIAVAVKP